MLSKRNRGRPAVSGSRHLQYRLRLNEDEMNKLEFVSWKTGKSKSEILRKAIEGQYIYQKSKD